ncbi:hypothetical protein C0995_002046 [Termitomyces sp. Mi166|nr:hypothetical protein C0995_002046 [Termitomyces sp. Mi166\
MTTPFPIPAQAPGPLVLGQPAPSEPISSRTDSLRNAPCPPTQPSLLSTSGCMPPTLSPLFARMTELKAKLQQRKMVEHEPIVQPVEHKPMVQTAEHKSIVQPVKHEPIVIEETKSSEALGAMSTVPDWWPEEWPLLDGSAPLPELAAPVTSAVEPTPLEDVSSASIGTKPQAACSYEPEDPRPWWAVPPPPDWKMKVTQIYERTLSISGNPDVIEMETRVYHRRLRNVAYLQRSLLPPQPGYYGLNHAFDPKLEKEIEREMKVEAKAKRREERERMKKAREEKRRTKRERTKQELEQNVVKPVKVAEEKRSVSTRGISVTASGASCSINDPAPATEKLAVFLVRARSPAQRRKHTIPISLNSSVLFIRKLIDNVGPPGKYDVKHRCIRHGRGHISASALRIYD